MRRHVILRTLSAAKRTKDLVRRLFPIIALVLALPLSAQITGALDTSAPLSAGADPGIPQHDLIALSGAIEQRSGDDVRGVITAVIENGWHINSNKPLDEFLIPSELKLESAQLTGVQYPQHILRGFTFSGGKELAVYEGTIRIPFTAKLASGATSITAKLHYQACNDKVCLPPRNAMWSGGLQPAVNGGLKAAAPLATTGFTPHSQAPANPTAPPPTGLSATYASHGLPLTLAIIFLGGLALNLTPCVFPLIPITVGFFAMQSDGRRSRRFALSASYVLGIIVTYSVLGVVAALSGKMFGAWLQSKSVLIGLAVLMLVLASSMFGAWEFRVPQFIANRSGGRAGVAGALTMGLLVGIVAAPCIGPFVVALFALVAAIAKPAVGLAMFATLAFGLGFPYLVALNALPKPGEWMVQVKKAMGFVLVAMAVYFLRPIIGETAFRWGVAASLLIGAAYLFLSRGPRGRVMRLVCASLLLVAGAAFAIPPRKGVEVVWDKYDAAKVAASRKPVIIDFYATWCIPCKELDDKTFGDKRVAAELDRFTRVKADLTAADDPVVQELTKKYRIVGVPTIVLIDAKGQENESLRLTGFEKAEPFLARIQKVR
jgi:thiol:disulfide interchange protein DsbD